MWQIYKSGKLFHYHFLPLIVRWTELIKTQFKFWDNYINYSNDPKFSDRQVRANSVDPDQTAPLIRVYTVWNSIYIFRTHYSMVEPSCSNFREITANFSGVRNFRIFTVFQVSQYCYFYSIWLYEPHHEKTLIWGLRPGKTQTGLRSHRS